MLAISGVDAVYVVKWNETAVLGGSVLLSCETPLGSYKVGKHYLLIIGLWGPKKRAVSQISPCVAENFANNYTQSK